MKRFSMKRPLVFCVSVALLFTACQKGDTGPAGPEGEPGEQGVPGTSGIYYSDWLDVSFDEDMGGGVIEAPLLSDSIIAYGAVKVYMNINTQADPSVVALPYYDNGLIFGIDDLSVVPVFKTGLIYLVSYYNLGTYEDAGEKTLQYRYVLIPGGMHARMASIDWNDYEQVTRYLELDH